jgi:hypothetical protein
MAAVNQNAISRRYLQFWGLFALLIFVMCPFLNAQIPEESGNRVAKTSEGFILYQIISFPAVPNVIRYEVEIELIGEEEPISVEKIETTVNSIEVSLKAGDYRYRITAYNRMNLIEGRSEWQDFQILPAVEPSVENYRPYYGLFFELDGPNAVIIITGSGLLAESEFALVKSRPLYDWSGVSLEGRGDVIFPSNVEVDENQARLTFERGALKRGEYEIFVRNPGGLWVCFGKVHAGFQNKSDFTFSFGYSPMIAAFDIENSLGWSNKQGDFVQRLDGFNPVGYNLRLGWLPIKTRAGNFGFELQFYFLVDNILLSEQKGGNIFQAFQALSYVTFNLFYQFPMTGRWQHNLRLGVGTGDSFHYIAEDTGDQGEYNNLIPVYFNMGYSAQFFLWKNLYLEAGLDIQYALSPNSSYPLDHLIFRPVIGIGWQLNRWAEYAEVTEWAQRGQDYSVPVTEPPKSEHLVSISYSPMIPMSGFDMYGTGGTNEQMESLQPFNPAGMGIRYAYFPCRWNKNKLGVRFELAFLEHPNREILAPAGLSFFDLLSHISIGPYYQRVLSEKWQIGAFAGLGFSNPYDYSDSFNTLSLAMNFGAAVQYFFWKNAFLEAGVDIILTGNDNIKTAFRPSIAVGWQFRRNNETGLRLQGTGFPML